MKRRQDFEGEAPNPKRQGGPRSSQTQPCALKFLTPEALASAIIGKGGTVIAAMRQSAQAGIGLTDRHDTFPGTSCRILTAQAQTEEALAEVARQIVAKLAECAQDPRAAASDSVGSPGELRLQTLVPRAAVGGLIGKGGAAIRALREQSGAKVSIAEPFGSGFGADQVVTISGTQQGLEYVMAEVNKQIQAVNKEDWFPGWVAGAGGDAAPAARNGGGERSHQGRGGSKGWSDSSSMGSSSMVALVPSGGGGGNGLDIMNRVAQGLPSYVMDDPRGFALSCVVPNRLVGGLIGRGGAGTKEVQSLTGTKIGIREIPGDSENRSMNIAGPLANTCAAYMLMMKRYLDSEAQAE